MLPFRCTISCNIISTSTSLVGVLRTIPVFLCDIMLPGIFAIGCPSFGVMMAVFTQMNLVLIIVSEIPLRFSFHL